jgi:putative endonuclease
MQRELGKAGEAFCIEYLTKHGCQILATNFRSPWGEIDLVARDGEFLVFVEVKTRSGSMESAISSVTRAKMRRLARTAAYFLAQNRDYESFFTRFDVIALQYDRNTDTFRVRLLQDAFRPLIED